MSDYPDAISYLVDSSRVFIGQNSHSAIVLHGTGGNPDQTAQQLGDYFRTTPLETSVHFGIDRAGVVCQYVSLADGAAGNCCVETGHDPFWDQFGGDNLNIHTISIEHENDQTNSLPLTDAQKQASFKLIAFLVNLYGLTPDHIKSHASIAPQTRTSCPGPAFPWQELFNYLQGGGDMPTVLQISQCGDVFEETTKDQRWHCKRTGFDIALGMLNFYRAYGQSGLNGLSWLGLPLSGEVPLAAYPGVTLQRFERGVQIYDPQRHVDNPPGVTSAVYVAHIDNGPGQDPRIALLNANVADLKTKLAQSTGVSPQLHDALVALKGPLSSFT